MTTSSGFIGVENERGQAWPGNDIRFQSSGSSAVTLYSGLRFTCWARPVIVENVVS